MVLFVGRVICVLLEFIMFFSVICVIRLVFLFFVGVVLEVWDLVLWVFVLV